MKNQPADIIATIEFLKTESGGRAGPTPQEKFGCIMTLEGNNYDVRLDLNQTGSVFPGQVVRVPVAFLYFDDVRPYLSKGKRFSIWEFRTIAIGTIDELLFST